jgi:hypothetical protein
MITPEYLQTLHDLRNEMRRTLHLIDGRPYDPVKEIDTNVEYVKGELKHLRSVIIFNSKDFMVESILNSLFETIEEDEVLGLLREQNDSGVQPARTDPKGSLDKPYFE